MFSVIKHLGKKLLKRIMLANLFEKTCFFFFQEDMS